MEPVIASDTVVTQQVIVILFFSVYNIQSQNLTERQVAKFTLPETAGFKSLNPVPGGKGHWLIISPYQG